MCLILSQCLVKQRQSTSSSSLWNNNCSHKHLTLTVSQPWLFLHSQAHYFTKNSTLCQACPGCGHRQLGLSLAQDLLACGDLQEAETRHSTLIRCQRLHTENTQKKPGETKYSEVGHKVSFCGTTEKIPHSGVSTD